MKNLMIECQSKIRTSQYLLFANVTQNRHGAQSVCHSYLNFELCMIVVFYGVFRRHSIMQVNIPRFREIIGIDIKCYFSVVFKCLLPLS